jgi:hypothetical protein
VRKESKDCLYGAETEAGKNGVSPLRHMSNQNARGGCARYQTFSNSSLEEEKRAPSGWCEPDHHDCNRRGLHPWCRAHIEERVVKRDTTTVPEKTKKVGMLPTNGKSNEGNEEKILSRVRRGVLIVFRSVACADIVRIAVRQPTSPTSRWQSLASEVRLTVGDIPQPLLF